MVGFECAGRRRGGGGGGGWSAEATEGVSGRACGIERGGAGECVGGVWRRRADSGGCQGTRVAVGRQGGRAPAVRARSGQTRVRRVQGENVELGGRAGVCGVPLGAPERLVAYTMHGSGRRWRLFEDAVERFWVRRM